MVTVAVTGELPRFGLYLQFVFGYVSLANYSGANWLKAIDPRELVWVPLALLYFGIATIAWRTVLEKENEQSPWIDRLLAARLAATAACAVLLLSLLFFDRSWGLFLCGCAAWVDAFRRPDSGRMEGRLDIAVRADCTGRAVRHDSQPLDCDSRKCFL